MVAESHPGQVSLRSVIESDLLIFYEHQRDAESVRMADFPAREREAHMRHWHKIMADPSTTLRARYTLLRGYSSYRRPWSRGCRSEYGGDE